MLKEMLTPRTAPRVFFTGHVDHEDVVEYYRQAAVVVNPSLSEAFGMSLVEAMVAGIPVIAARVGGMVEIVKEGETGLLVEPGDTGSLARAICYLLEHDDVRSRMGEAARRRARALFSWDRVAARLVETYEELCGGRLSARRG
jgi:glycosyltransferase involved in cell wall biosynthesis